MVDGRIAWCGPDRDAAGIGASASVDLDGALVLPGFVDAHVHVTETGLLLAGLDLSTARSVTEVLDLVAAAARARPGRAVLGHGWDELRFAEGRPPTAAELDRAAPGREVYLSRVDVHSAVVSGALAQRCDLATLAGWDPSGRIERDAHHAARHVTRFALEPGDRQTLQRLALRAAVATGITQVHEMSAPHVAPDTDLAALVALVARPGDGGALPEVVPYRGELARDEADARRIVAELAEAGLPSLAGLAGDLMVDGSIGSRTAALTEDYTDAPGHRGHLYLDRDEIRDHVLACTRAGLQAGFHVIGDAAVTSVLAGFEAAAAVLGPEAIRAGRHRLEHLEAVDTAGVAVAARLGLIASVQPGFDAAWGGPDRMYAVRLGPDRAAGLNPFAALAAAGVELAFGSDSPVTPFAPWETIRAALAHRTGDHRLDLPTALSAHLAPHPGRGDAGLRVGDPATFAAWRSPGLRAAAPGRETAALTEELGGGDAVPACVLTVIRGAVAFEPS